MNEVERKRESADGLRLAESGSLMKSNGADQPKPIKRSTNELREAASPTNSIQLFFLPLKREEKWMNLMVGYAAQQR